MTAARELLCRTRRCENEKNEPESRAHLKSECTGAEDAPTGRARRFTLLLLLFYYLFLFIIIISVSEREYGLLVQQFAGGRIPAVSGPRAPGQCGGMRARGWLMRGVALVIDARAHICLIMRVIRVCVCVHVLSVCIRGFDFKHTLSSSLSISASHPV